MENESTIVLISFELVILTLYKSLEDNIFFKSISNADKKALSITLFFLKSKLYGSIISISSTL